MNTVTKHTQKDGDRTAERLKDEIARPHEEIAKIFINTQGNEVPLKELEEHFSDFVVEELSERDEETSVTVHGGQKHILLNSKGSSRIESEYDAEVSQ